MSQQKPAATGLQARLNEQHEYISLILREGKTRLTLTYSYSGDRASASVDLDTQLMEKACNRFSALRSALKEPDTLGHLTKRLLATAQGCSTIAEFVEKM